MARALVAAGWEATRKVLATADQMKATTQEAKTAAQKSAGSAATAETKATEAAASATAAQNSATAAETKVATAEGYVQHLNNALAAGMLDFEINHDLGQIRLKAKGATEWSEWVALPKGGYWAGYQDGHGRPGRAPACHV